MFKTVEDAKTWCAGRATTIPRWDEIVKTEDFAELYVAAALLRAALDRAEAVIAARSATSEITMTLVADDRDELLTAIACLVDRVRNTAGEMATRSALLAAHARQVAEANGITVIDATAAQENRDA